MVVSLLAIGAIFLCAAAWFAVTQPIFSKPIVQGPAPAPTRLETHVRTLSQTFFPRNCAHPENLDRAAAYIHHEFELAGAAVSEQAYTIPPDFPTRFDPGKEADLRAMAEKGIHTFRNVIASFGPDTRERIVIGAHYDAFGELPGADDNASGVAGLIELAHFLGKTPLRTRVELVAYTLEEPPFFRTDYAGSAVHARSLKKQAIPLRAMIALEMIGYFKDEDGSQRYPLSALKLFYPSQGNFAVVVGSLDQPRIVRRVKRAMRSASVLPVYSLNGPKSIEGIDWSDHMHYWEQGYNAVMVSDTAIYRNHNYHKSGDTADTLDYSRMALVVQAVYGAVLELARQ
jgi:Zn-dependent M28 family amino/carboxypeptidase